MIKRKPATVMLLLVNVSEPERIIDYQKTNSLQSVLLKAWHKLSVTNTVA